ncbi:MAG: DNA topoisomerase I [Thermoplasmata archaeon]
MSTLVICEKDNAARRIAAILSGNSAERRMLDGVPIYTFSKDGTDYIVIGLKGHILTLDYDQRYSLWHRVRPRELINIEPKKRVIAHSIVTALRKLAPDVDRVIVATDYDREGELIGVEALEKLREFRGDVPVKRARFSSLTPNEVRTAFANLGDVDHRLSDSALARQHVDLVWGATLTRYLSILTDRTGKDFLSVGRVQTPTLALILEREDEIRRFKPEPYWEVEGNLEKSTGERFRVRSAKERYRQKEEAERVVAAARSSTTGRVVGIRVERRREKPPTPFNTTQFLAVASTLGFQPARAMSIAEDLYTSGYISYPRTDNTVYPPGENLRAILQTLARPGSDFEKEAGELLKKDRLTPTRGKTEATDHPPIHPTDLAQRSELSREQWKIYELVVRRFFATLADEAVSEVTSATVDIGGQPFLARGLRAVEPGWRKYYPYVTLREAALPPLVQGEIVRVLKIDMKEKLTQPPKRYTQGGLIQEMESLGLGTKATRHEIIQKLYARDYVKDRSPVPTETGEAVTRALQRYAEHITRPDMTAALERDMDLIADGKKSVKEVVEESRRMLAEVMDELDRNKEAIGEAIREALRSQNTLGPCPKCGTGELVVMRSWRGKRFAGCSNYPKCRNSFPLPQRGRIEVLQEKCPACGHLQVNVLHSRRKPWTVCLNATCPTRAERERKRGAEGETQGEKDKEVGEVDEGGAEGASSGEGEEEEEDVGTGSREAFGGGERGRGNGQQNGGQGSMSDSGPSESPETPRGHPN